MKPTIAITMGDPAGVGPEIILRAVSHRGIKRWCDVRIIGDMNVLTHVARRLGLPIPDVEKVVNVSNLDPKGIKPGIPTKGCARAVIGYIEKAVEMVRMDEADALVTAPINKDSLKKAGFPFPGHTEFLAHLTGTGEFCMMLGGRNLRVVLVTIHEPLRKVPELLTTEKILTVIRITNDSLRKYFGIDTPRIGVAGLNPHAGEGGMFGDEERRIIRPAIKRAQRLSMDVTGPLPPDTVFYRAYRGEFDCVVCMYHDQGLIPLKLLHFEDGVNVTLGLPVIRTSVDHGTAYDIAWKGIANPGSIIEAIKTAVRMAVNKKRG